MDTRCVAVSVSVKNNDFKLKHTLCNVYQINIYYVVVLYIILLLLFFDFRTNYATRQRGQVTDDE